MKARIIEQTESQTKKSNVVLTIGMIVKNEERTLEDCLRALAPLREAVPCRLIVTDTGSTDRTIEIAETYADEVRHFVWCNDFAAARNTTLEKIDSEWYMYLDADEILDDSIREIADFFKSGRYLQYNTADINLRNYMNFQHTDYTDYMESRLYKVYPGMKFIGSIHEALPNRKPCFSMPKVIVHHEGYVTYHVGALLKDKSRRNREPIEKELKKAPTARMYYHYADTFLMSVQNEVEKKEDALKKGIALGRRDAKEFFGGSLCVELARTYQKKGDKIKLHQLLENWFRQGYPEIMAQAEMHFMAGQEAVRQLDAEKGILHLKEFLRIYEKQQETQSVAGSYTIVLHYATEQGAAQAKADLALCYLIKQDFAQAHEWMKKADPGTSMWKNGKPFLLAEFAEYLKGYQDTELLEETYQKLWKKKHEFTQNLLVAILRAFYAPCREQQALLQVLAQKGQEEDPATWLARIKLKQKDIDKEKALSVILQDKEAVKNQIFAEIIDFASDSWQQTEEIFEKLDLRYAESFVVELKINHSDFSRKVFDYIRDSEPPHSMKIARWRICIMEAACNWDNDYTEEEWMGLLQRYAREGDAFCKKLYTKDVYCEEQLDVLPVRHAYLYCLFHAFEAKAKKDIAGYLRYLNMGLKRYETMKNTTEYLLMLVNKEIDKEEKQQKAEKKELEQLKKKVKENICFLIEQGKKPEAARLFRQYKMLAPEDTDNAEMEKELMEE